MVTPARRSVVLLSGGLLSAIALELAARVTEVKVALYFSTGARAGEDYRAATRLAKDHDLMLEVASLPGVIAGDVAAREPGVYALMATIGSFYAHRVGADEVWTGLAPHLHPERVDMAISTLRHAQNLTAEALGKPITIVTARDTDRARAFETAAALGVLDRIVSETHDCERNAAGARGDRSGRGYRRYVWGHGCGACASCQARAEAWSTFERSRGVLE